MKPRFCQYCGLPLTENCSCAREIAEAEQKFIEEYESNPEVCAGWYQQDIIDMRRREK